MTEDRLINLQTEREALKQASDSSNSLEMAIARITAELGSRAEQEKPLNVITIKSVGIDAKATVDSWPEDKSFPLTPLETWYLLRGYAIKPTETISDDLLGLFPVKIITQNGYIKLA